jgi:hypothetical protein
MITAFCLESMCCNFVKMNRKKQPVDLTKYEVQFSRLLSVEAAREHFRQFLRKQLAEESLSFLVAVTEFKTVVASEKVNSLLRIYDAFLKMNAEQEINIPSREREQVLKILTESNQFNKTDVLLVSEKIFDTMYNTVYRELREDR